MGAYLSIVAGAIKLFNYIAGALQQHHDELNGRRAQAVDDLQASLKADQHAAQTQQTVHDLSPVALDAELRDGSTANRQ